MPQRKTAKTVKKSAPKQVQTVAPPPVPVIPTVLPPVKTEAEKIWAEIQNLPIQMFGLPNQFVSMHCTPIQVEPSKLYVAIHSSAALPSLETAVGAGFTVELVDKYVIVARAPKPVIIPKR